MKWIKKLILSVADHNKALRRMLVWAVKTKRKHAFNAYYKKHATVDEKLIMFEAFGGRSYGCNPKALYLEMLADDRYKEYKKVWCFKEPEKFAFLAEDENTEVIKYRSAAYYDYYASAKYWITNYRLPQELQKKEEQVYVQCWHGVPLKRLGYDIAEYHDRTVSTKQLRKQYTKAAMDYTYLLSPSKYFTEKLTSAYDLKTIGKDDIFIEKGYPRNDFLYRYTEEDVARVKETLALPEGKKYILYCPTYRDDQFKLGVGNTLKLGVDFDRLQRELSDEYVILFRAHYLVKSQFDFKKYKDFIVDVSDYPDINELYIVSDVLITDYSSVMFDYAILERPIILYMYDMEEYKSKLRDFYLGFDQLPVDPIEKEDELIAAIQNTDGFALDEKYKTFNQTHNAINGPHTGKVVLNEIFPA